GLVYGDSPSAAALGKLVAEAALPSSRLGDNADDLGAARNGLLERGLQSRHLAPASDEFGEPPHAGHLETGPQPTHTLDLEDVHRLVDGLHSESSEAVEGEVPGDELRRGFGEIYLAPLNAGLHSRRQADR